MSQELNSLESKLGDGYLSQSLSRSSKQIRADRGQEISASLETQYRRNYEDKEDEIRTLRSKQKRMFDFSGDSTTSLVLKDYNAKDIFLEDIAIEDKIRDLEIDKEAISSRYTYLIGKDLKNK